MIHHESRGEVLVVAEVVEPLVHSRARLEEEDQEELEESLEVPGEAPQNCAQKEQLLVQEAVLPRHVVLRRAAPPQREVPPWPH